MASPEPGSGPPATGAAGDRAPWDDASVGRGRPLQSVDSALVSAAKRLLRAYAVATAGLRGLPDFLIIGAKRGGTTSLSRYLFAHPDVMPLVPRVQRIKGVHFFDQNFWRGERWYRSFFPLDAARRIAERRRTHRTGEASPYYLFHPVAAERAARVAPEARIVVILRNPVDRAFSHWRERSRNGGEPLSFEDALDAEEERLRGLEDYLRASERHVSYAHEQQSYLAQGEYLGSLRRWTDRYPDQRMLVLLSEALEADPAVPYGRLLEFLGLRPFRPAEFARYNFHPGPTMDPALRLRLLRHYRPHNEALAAALGIDLSGWNR
jgi:hypothetical protein